jgi:hypothetical protein
MNRILGELQHFLIRAASLVPGQNRHFHIDPEDTIFPLLGNSSDLGQVLAAYKIIRSRVSLRQRFLDKYKGEFYSLGVNRRRSPALSDVHHCRDECQLAGT